MNHTIKPRVRLCIDFFSIAWDSVHTALCKNFDLSEQDAANILREFIKKLKSPVNVQWLKKKELSRSEQELVLCLCELHGADVITIVYERVFNVSLLELKYRVEVEIDPFANRFRGADLNGIAQGRYRLSIFGLSLNIKSMSHAIVFYAGIVFLGAILYAVLIGFILYALAILLLFIADPELMAPIALKHPPAALALLCLLVGFAGLSGKAFRNIMGLLRQKSANKGLV